MKLSVLIATYGDEHWDRLARRAVASVPLDAHELVHVHQPDGDIATARNAAAAEATGDWLCFLDADDELDAGFVAAIRVEHERQLRRNADDAGLLFNPAVSYVNKGRAARPIQWRKIPLEQANWLIVATVVRKAMFDEVGGFRPWPHGFEDWDLWCRVWQQGVQVVPVRNAVYVAHRNWDSKHHVLARDAPHRYHYWHQRVGHANWPDVYEATTAEEDARETLLNGDGEPVAELRRDLRPYPQGTVGVGRRR